MDEMELDPMMRTLHGLDRQPSPDPQFVHRLGAKLMPSTMDRALSPSGSITPSATSPQIGANARSMRRLPRKWAASPSLSAGVMVTVIVIVAIVVVIGGRDQQEAPRYMAFASPAASDATPGAAGCAIAPRELQDVTQIARWVVEGIPENAEFATPEATADATLAGPTLPAGKPASHEVTEAVNGVYAMLKACWNEGDYLRAYALYSDNGIARALAPNGVANVDAIAQLSTPPSPGQKQYSQEPFTRVEVLPDGRVVGYQPNSYNPVGYVIFVSIDGHWMIDEVFTSHG